LVPDDFDFFVFTFLGAVGNFSRPPTFNNFRWIFFGKPHTNKPISRPWDQWSSKMSVAYAADLQWKLQHHCHPSQEPETIHSPMKMRKLSTQITKK
jgi:hypothetical protein